MINKKSAIVLTTALLLSTYFAQHTFGNYDNYAINRVSNLIVLEKNSKINSFSSTRYFGSISKFGFIDIQKRYGESLEKMPEVKTIIGYKRANTTISRGSVSRNEISIDETNQSKEVQLIPWFGKVDKLFGIGDVAIIIDIETNTKFKIKRTYGYNHADVETLTAFDTHMLKEAVGGSWNWIRRPVIVEVNGYRIAASLTAMPHAGLDNFPTNSMVKGRSEGYGSGVNLDSVKDNEMDGHFDIHFYGSKTHASNRVDKSHQESVQKAYKSSR